MFVRVVVFVCAHLRVCVCVCVCLCVRMCVCLCVRMGVYTRVCVVTTALLVSQPFTRILTNDFYF